MLKILIILMSAERSVGRPVAIKESAWLCCILDGAWSYSGGSSLRILGLL